MNKKPILLGITGAFGSGKTTASSFFVERGFELITLSSFLEEELRSSPDGPITRRALQDKGNELRKQFGPGILAEKALDYISKLQKQLVVIDGIRNLGEIEVLRQNPDFVLLAIVANRKIRFDRLKMSPRRESLTMDLFKQLDYRDLGVGENDTGLQTGLCIAMADIFIDNNGSREDLKKKLEGVIAE